jgi:predicted GNAT family acetyltransferase
MVASGNTGNSAVIRGDGRLYIKRPTGEAELLYRIEGSIMSIYRTYVPEPERGKGLAEKLALEAFAMAESLGLKVRPDCSYIRHFVSRRGEFSGMVVDSDAHESCDLPKRQARGAHP